MNDHGTKWLISSVLFQFNWLNLFQSMSEIYLHVLARIKHKNKSYITVSMWANVKNTIYGILKEHLTTHSMLLRKFNKQSETYLMQMVPLLVNSYEDK